MKQFAPKQPKREDEEPVRRSANAFGEFSNDFGGNPSPNKRIQAMFDNIQRAIDEKNAKRTQPKLTIGAPNDKYEKDADRTAEIVMSKPNPEPSKMPRIMNLGGLNHPLADISRKELLQRLFAPETTNAADFATPAKNAVQRQGLAEGEAAQRSLASPPASAPAKRTDEEEAKKAVQKMADNSVQGKAITRFTDLEATLRASYEGGQPMPEEVRVEMETRFGGLDFSHVRIHIDGTAQSMCVALHARAFTSGSHIYFNAGEWDPASKAGKTLLAHELTHTVHQGKTKGKIQREAEEADVQMQTEDAVQMQAEDADVQMMAEEAVQKQEAPDVQEMAAPDVQQKEDADVQMQAEDAVQMQESPDVQEKAAEVQRMEAPEVQQKEADVQRRDKGTGSDQNQSTNVQAKSDSPEVQAKPQDHIHHEDGDGVKGRMDQKFKDEGADDADPDAETPEIDPEERSAKKGEIREEGIAKPSVDRPGNEKPKVKKAGDEGKKKQKEKPKTDEKGKKGKKKPESRADLTAMEERESNALMALQDAEAMEMPAKPKPLKAPRMGKPKDSKNKELPSNSSLDKAVRALHEIAKLFVEQAFGLKKEAFSDAKSGKKLLAKVHDNHAKIESAKAASDLMEKDNAYRDTVNEKQGEALAKVEKDTAFVKEKAPEVIGRAKKGKEDSGPMAADAKRQQRETEEQQPEDDEAAGDAKKQAEESAKVSNDSESMDNAFGDTTARAEGYQKEAEEGEQKNQKTKAKLDENKATSDATKVELKRIKGHNKQSKAMMKAYNKYPARVARQTSARANSAEELYRAAVVMNDQLIDIQDEYFAAMGALEGREEAQKKKDEEAKALQAQGGAGAPQVLSPEEQMLLNMSEMGDQEMETMMMGMDETELVSLESTLDGMETQEEQPKEEERNPMLEKPDAAGRTKVDLSKMFDDPNKKPENPDPRQEKIDAIEGRRGERIGYVKKISDDNYSFLTAEQKVMLSQKLAMSDATSGLFDMDILEVGKQAIIGMIDPRASLSGIVDGASKMASGFVNLFSAEAWAKDPLGNLLQSASDIATGLTTILVSITGLATTMTILSGVLIVLSWFTLSPVLGPFIGFLTSVISTVGSWAIVTGLIALELNYLTYIKNLHDASVSTNTDELIFESDEMKSNMTDAFGNVMAVVGAKGDVAGAKQLQKSILKGGGAKKFHIDKGEAFKQGAKNTGASIQNFVKGGIRSGTKQLFKQGVTRLKNGFKNTLKKIREGVKNAPDNLKTGVKDKWKALKESFTGPKKLDTIDTPHGKLTKAPEGGSLGDFQGQKVKAEMDFPDGHKAKNLESGKCAICSNCETIKAKFGDELDLPKNKDLADDLKKIEAELKAKPGDPDLIAKQKAMHDKLYKDKLERLKTQKEGLDPNSPKAQEIEAEINTTKSERVDNTLDIYDQKVKNGQNTRKGKTDAEIEQIKADVQAELDGGRVMNPESGKFHADGTSGPKIDDATRAKVEAGTTSKGKNRTPNEGTPEMEAMSKKKAEAKDRIEKAKEDALKDPDHELKKAESLEKRHPEAEHRKKFEEEYDELMGSTKETNPNYLSDRETQFRQDRDAVIEDHSQKYDTGTQNSAKGDAFEDARLDQLNAEGGNFKKRKPSEKIEFEYDGQKVVVSPDLEDLAPPGGYIEMKSGKLSLTPEVEDQILRYAQLSQTNKVKITYELMDGASDSVIQAFEKYGIDYIDYSKIP